MPHDRYHPLSGPRGDNTTQNCHFRLPVELHEALKAAARERSMPTAVFVRDLLTEGLANRARRQ